MIREEVEAILDEKAVIDSHVKFRKLVEAKLGREFSDTDDNWDVTYAAWSDVLQESNGTQADQETLDYYVKSAVKRLSEAAHHHTEEVTWDDIKRWAPDAYASAMQHGYTNLQPYLFEPLDGSDNTVDVDGEQWVLHIEESVGEDEDTSAAYEWEPDMGEWGDLLYHS